MNPQNAPLTPAQALNLLDQATSALSLNRGDHAKIVEAVQVVAKLVEEKTKDAPAEPEVVPARGR